MTANERPGLEMNPNGFDRIGLSGFWLIIRRHVLKIVLIVLAVVAVTWLALSRMEEQYSARSTIVLTLQDTRVSQTEAQLESFELSRAVVETELDVLRSRAFAEQVAEALSLFDDEDFVPIKDPSVSGTLHREQVIDKILTTYSVHRSGESLAVNISTTANNATLAADIANTVAGTYILNSSSAQTESIETSIDFLRERVASLSEELTQSELELANFIRENELDDEEQSDRLRSQVLYLNTILKTANEEGRTSDTITRQREDLARVQAELQERTRAELSQMRMVRLLELQQSRYQTAIEKLNELETQIQFVGQNARQVTQARVPTSPSWPNRPVALAMAVVAGSFLAIVVALMLDALNRRLWSEEQTIKIAGIPNAGFFPRFTKSFARRKRGLVVSYLVEHPRSMFAQAVRSTTNLWLGEDRPTSTIMVTSGLPDEGKSTVSVALGTSAALDGFKVLVIDLDHHRKGASRQFGYEGRSQSLADVLSGAVEPVGITYNDEQIVGLKMLSLDTESTGNLKDQRQMLQELKTKMQSEYDLIVVDTPPVLVVDDACRFGIIADEIWHVVRWGRTTESVLKDTVDRLKRDGLPIAATIINDVDTRRHKNWGYGGYAQYYNYGNAYYR